MPSSILSFKKKSTFATWLSSKLAINKRKLNANVNSVDELSDPGGCSPLIGNMDANNSRSKHKAKHTSAATAVDDCNQQLLYSDQASAVARIDGLAIDSYSVEQEGSDCSVTDSVLAATTHMATIRSLLVSHISETHDESSIKQRLASGPSSVAVAAGCRSSMAEAASRRLSYKDRTVQALLADQMQLLDLVQTLIADHRMSLLEQQRLQQQLNLAERALQEIQLDKERAVALAEVRAEQVSRVQADLAAVSAEVSKLHSVRAISSQCITLPAAVDGVHSISSGAPEDVEGVEARDATSECAGQLIAPGVVTSRTSVPRSDTTMADGSVGSTSGLGANTHSSKASAESRLGIGQRMGSSRPKEAAQRKAHTPTGNRPSSGSRRRLLTEGGKESIPKAASQHTAVARKTEGRVQHGTSNIQQQHDAAQFGAVVKVQVQQQQKQQQDMLSAAAAQHAATVAAAPSAASRLAQAHASVLEGLLLQRLEQHTCAPDAAGHQHAMTVSIESDTSALSLPCNGVGDSAAAAVAAGPMKQQLKQMLQKPWLSRPSQGEEVSSQQRDPGAAPREPEARQLHSKRTHTEQQHSVVVASKHEQADSDLESESSEDDSGSSSDTTMVDGEIQQPPAGEHPVPLQQQAANGQQAGISSSNGSSWPRMKASVTAAAAGGSALPPGSKPSSYKRPVARLRPRAQPVQMSTSLESAATLPVVMQHAPQSHSSEGSSMTTAGGSTLGEPHCKGACVDMEYCHALQQNALPLAVMTTAGQHLVPETTAAGIEEEARGQQRSSRSNWTQQQQPAAVDMSCELVQQASVENIGSAIGRRKLGIPPVAGQEIYTAAQHTNQGQPPQHKQRNASELQHCGASAAACPFSKAAETAIDSDAEMSTSSEFACASVASVATGCSTLSNMAGIDFVPRSHIKVRPPGVPKLTLTSATSATPCPQSACTRHIAQSPSNKVQHNHQLDDIAPLKAQKGTPRGAAVAAASKAGVQYSGGSFSSTAGSAGAKAVPSTAMIPRAHSFTAGQGNKQSAAGAGCGAGAPSPAGSMQSRRAATVGGALPRVSSSSGGGGSGGQYWGSSAGSYPVSEEPSRLPTPNTDIAEQPAHAPAAAAVPELGASASDAAATAAAPESGCASRSGLAAQQQHQIAAAAATGTLQAGPANTPRNHTCTFMTMRPVHLYKSVSTQFAMYSPLRGNLHALGQNKPGGSPPPGDYAEGSESTGLSGVSPGPSIGIGALGATAAVGEYTLGKDVSGNGSEHQWHALLKTVPEEEGLCTDSLAADPAAGENVAPAAMAGGGSGDDRMQSSRSASTGSYAASPSPELVYATSLPTLEDFQRMVQQEQQQRDLEQRQHQRQQRRQATVSDDVVDRRPLLKPGSSSPEAGVRCSNSRPHDSRSSSSYQRLSLRRSTRTTAAPVPPPIEVDGLHTAAIGPLTASSPSRKRSSAALSSSGTTPGPAHPPRRSRESHHRVSSSDRAHSGDPAVQVEAAVTAQVAADATRLTEQHEKQAVQGVETCQPPGQQDYGTTVTGPTGSGPTPVSGKGGHRIRRRWQQQQDCNTAAGSVQVIDLGIAGAGSSMERISGQYEQQEDSRCHAKSNRRLLQSQQQEEQVQACQQEQISLRRSRHKRSNASSNKGSSKRSSKTGTMCSAPAAGTAATSSSCRGDYTVTGCAELVTSYHNPLLMLEGLDAAVEVALIDAGMVPGLMPQGLSADKGWGVGDDELLAAGNSGLLTAVCRSRGSVDNHLGVDAASVPVHVTPLSKECSAGAVSQAASAVSAEQSAGGQLHWNPLYDPCALNGSPIPTY